MSNVNRFESRFEEWKHKFEAVVTPGILQIKTDLPQSDPCKIPLDNARLKLVDIETKIRNYTTNHKTQEYVYIQEYITDLYLELDKIEVNTSEGHQDLRKQLYQELGQARLAIEKKLHENVDGCMECKKVRVLTK